MLANFLGEPAPFPISPWLFAGALRVPVVLAFGLHHGGNRYDLHFERFDFELTRERRMRNAALAEVVQRFAARMEHFARLAPYNWFNLYDFWDASRAKISDPGRGAGDGPGVQPGP
jgi:predicted LPLAT superfamily acyltransferase